MKKKKQGIIRLSRLLAVTHLQGIAQGIPSFLLYHFHVARHSQSGPLPAFEPTVKVINQYVGSQSKPGKQHIALPFPMLPLGPHTVY